MSHRIVVSQCAGGVLACFKGLSKTDGGEHEKMPLYNCFSSLIRKESLENSENSPVGYSLMYYFYEILDLLRTLR